MNRTPTLPAGPAAEGALRERSRQPDGRPSRVFVAVLALGLVGCALLERDPPPSPPAGVTDGAADPQRPVAPHPPPGRSPRIDLDSLAAAMLARADTTGPARHAALDAEIRDWLARLEFGDPGLAPESAEPIVYLRPWRGRLLDALGWLAFRGGDYRQAEAALVSAVEQIHSWGTTDGYAVHFWHLGRLYAARGRWRQAADAYLDAEIRGMGDRATTDLVVAWTRGYGSLRGLEQARAAERARVEDERRQSLVAGSSYEALPAFSWPRRTGPPMGVSELAGRRAVVAAWGPDCPGCSQFAAALEPLAERLARRGEILVAVWLGDDPAGAGPVRPYTVLLPLDPVDARRRLRADSLPLLAVVDAEGLIRYRHAGSRAFPPPIEDIVVQLDHLARTRY